MWSLCVIFYLSILAILSYAMPCLVPFCRKVIYDWNDTAAPAHRKDVNYFVPCYYQAFPPYREQRLTPDTCSVAQYAADDMPVRGQGNATARGALVMLAIRLSVSVSICLSVLPGLILCSRLTYNI